MSVSQSKQASWEVWIINNQKILIVSSLFILTYVPTLFWMWDRWFARDSDYTHGIFIPFVSAFLIWQRREELAAIPPQSSTMGLPLIVLGLFFHIFSSLFRVYFSSGFSMLITLVGIILYFWGNEFLKKIIFPAFFLIFMIPVPLVVVTDISFRMKILAAEIAASVLNQLGFSAIRDGSIIKLHSAYVIVDDICSGLRSLISLTALGSIFAYWMKGPMYKRLLLWVFAIPIAIITNAMRIIFLSVIAEIWGPQYAVGLIHDVSGFMVFVLAFILLFATQRILE